MGHGAVSSDRDSVSTYDDPIECGLRNISLLFYKSKYLVNISLNQP